MHYYDKHRITFVEGRYATLNVKNKINDDWYVIFVYVIRKKNNQTWVSDADQKSQPSGQQIMSETR